MPRLIPYLGIDNARAMIVVDGENLAIRFGALLKKRSLRPGREVVYQPDAYVWWKQFSDIDVVAGGGMLRTYYCTAIQGDHPKVEEANAALKAAGVGAPRVFKKVRGERSKRVDISLATDMLIHAARHHFDIAVLVAVTRTMCRSSRR